MGYVIIKENRRCSDNLENQRIVWLEGERTCCVKVWKSKCREWVGYEYGNLVLKLKLAFVTK
jgi:hypothetical protein